jgi:hypothetical protein
MYSSVQGAFGCSARGEQTAGNVRGPELAQFLNDSSRRRGDWRVPLKAGVTAEDRSLSNVLLGGSDLWIKLLAQVPGVPRR